MNRDRTRWEENLTFLSPPLSIATTSPLQAFLLSQPSIITYSFSPFPLRLRLPSKQGNKASYPRLTQTLSLSFSPSPSLTKTRCRYMPVHFSVITNIPMRKITAERYSLKQWQKRGNKSWTACHLWGSVSAQILLHLLNSRGFPDAWENYWVFVCWWWGRGGREGGSKGRRELDYKYCKGAGRTRRTNNKRIK